MPDLTIEIKGLDKLLKAFEKFPREIARDLSQAGQMAANDVILKTEGIGRHYPPAPPGSTPPAPYYQRGKGFIYASGKLGKKSENLGKQWYVKGEGFKTRIGNRASYAKWMHGEEQARAMKRIGWRKLLDVTKEKLPAIQKIYQQMVDRTIRRLGL